MIRPNYRDFRRSKMVVYSERQLKHSAKGSTWEEHKYIKRIDGTYYYPDSYEGGRHLPKGENGGSSKDDTISKLEDLTGMTRESLLELKNISQKNGYDSNEFKEMLEILSEGDEDQAKKMIKILKQDESKMDLSSEDVENLAKEVIRGNFGNGQVRRDLLGENYGKIQRRVDEILKSSTGSKKVSESSNESIKRAEKAASNASKIHSGIDIDKVMSVYNKKKK